MLISLQSDLKKRIRLSLIIDLANDSIGSSECRDSTNFYCIFVPFVFEMVLPCLLDMGCTFGQFCPFEFRLAIIGTQRLFVAKQ